KKSAIERASLVSGRAKLPPLPGLRSRWRSDVLLTGASLARHSVLGLSRASRVRRRTDGELFVPRRPEEARRMESVVGKSVIVQVRGQLLPAVIRACTEPLTTLTSDFSLVDVLREWVKLSDSSKCQALYVESKLLWAKRIITAEQQRRAVAWPSKVSHFLSLSSLSPLALPSFFAFSSLSSSPTFSPLLPEVSKSSVFLPSHCLHQSSTLL
ncbi:hypothetical protein GBAR_LOCUS26402, partial [Geodia barretti]